MSLNLDHIAQCVPGDALDASHVSITGPSRVASSAFDVDGILAASAAYSVAAADRYGAARGIEAPSREIDLGHLLSFCTTHVEIDGIPVPAWSDLSGVYPTLDGRHLQIHCNFAHHADGVVRRLGCAPDRESVANAIAQRDAFGLEAELIDDGMIAAATRTLDEWDGHPHAEATRTLPLITVEQVGDAAPIDRCASVPGTNAQVGRPGVSGEDALAGVKVLDCARVLAGPVAGQMLAGFGADVLRVGAAHLPSVPVGVISTGFGKRNAFADLRTDAARASMRALLGSTDVWIDAFRPGSFDSRGFDVGAVGALRPGIVVVQISAFDWSGPWAGRRGFDSIVQSTTGVRWAGGEVAVDAEGEASGGGPTGLPVPALDYATGFLAAGVAAELLRHQSEVGGSWLARLSLLRTRDWLVGLGGPNPYVRSKVTVDQRHLHTVDSEFGRVTTVTPFVGLPQSPPQRLGSSAATWA